MIYVLASELLQVEPLPFAGYLQKSALYSMFPWKRRLDVAMKCLQSVKSAKDIKSIEEKIRLLDKAAAQKCKPMMPEVFAKRSDQYFNNGSR
jgi:hypothetical protein